MDMNGTRLTIFGAGMAGLIAARMLVDRHPVVMERQEALPNNHHAVLRFRSSIVGDATNVPFRKVQVNKCVLSDESSHPIRDAAVYSRKVTGKLHARSILNTETSERYVAPGDFLQRLASTADIQFGIDFQDWSHNLIRSRGPVISTIPVPLMMGMFAWPKKPEFNSSKGWTIKASVHASLECSLHSTVYSARVNDIWYRASLTGSELMIEGVGEEPELSHASDVLQYVAGHFGLRFEDIANWQVYPAKYQKIADLKSEDRESVKRFVMWLSNEHGIYSLGRFATWRPKLLLDDLVNDVRVIARLIDGESTYNETINK